MDMTHPPLGPLAPYDPRYDPLVAPNPGRGTDYAPTYWVASAGTPPDDDGPITRDTDADVVIVGSGFTGLATALFLAREHGIRATVLEANRSIWGCTSRNGGQGQNASGGHLLLQHRPGASQRPGPGVIPSNGRRGP